MNAAIILSGGIGARLGVEKPKQYLKVGGRTILRYALENFLNSKIIDVIAIVCAPEYVDEISAEICSDKPLLFCEPGKTRQLSVLSGLNCLENKYGSNISKVIIHDGARPNVSERLIEECINACDDVFDGAMPVIGVKDTVYQSDNQQTISRLLDRSTLYAGQAPEAFDFRKYLMAHRSMSDKEILEINGSSEIAFKAGMKVKMVAGDPTNFKITDISDLNQFKSLHHES